MSVDLENINDNATTTFDGAIDVSNNGNQDVTLTVDNNSMTGVEFEVDNQDLGSGDTVQVDVVVDTTQEVDTSGTVTFNAST